MDEFLESMYNIQGQAEKNVPKTHGKNENATEAKKQWLHDILMVKVPKDEGVSLTRPVWHNTVDKAMGVK